jgi:hypothetical protein
VGSLLDASGADWVVVRVDAIHHVGQIVGMGLDQGQPRAFLMTPSGPHRLTSNPALGVLEMERSRSADLTRFRGPL